MLVTNVPAAALMVKLLDPWLAGYAVAATVVVLLLSRLVFSGGAQALSQREQLNHQRRNARPSPPTPLP